MTGTQIAFAFFLLAVAPGFGVCGAIAARSTRLRWLGGLALGTGTAWACLALSGVAAALLHPRYPVEGPPAFLALLYVIPGFLGGLLGVLTLIRRANDAIPDEESPDASRAKRLLVPGVACAVLGVFGIYYLFVSPLHRALPWGATDVRESYWEEGLLPDYSFCLKARIPESEFPALVERLDLSLHTEHRVYEDDLLWLQWASPFNEGDTSWWSPPPVRAGRTYVGQGGDEWILADWKEGWVYVSGHNH